MRWPREKECNKKKEKVYEVVLKHVLVLALLQVKMRMMPALLVAYALVSHEIMKVN